ncbi:MAG: c-type cytochrome [Granulosicoccaceae bacterium]
MNVIMQRTGLMTCNTAVLLCSFLSATVTHASSIEEGEKLYRQCAGCHQIGAGASNAFGPQLNGVMERVAAKVPGFDYSDAYTDAMAPDVKWNASSLSAFLETPLTNIPGTKMAFPGVKDQESRESIIAYLAAVNSDGNINRPENTKSVDSSKELTEKLPRVLAADVVVPEHGVLHLGRSALAEEVAAWDIDVRPDGKGLPIGSGSVIAGGEIYDAQCTACHGDFGEGTGRWPVLAGGQDTLTDDRPEKTIGSYWPYLSTVYDYVRRAMPFGNARSLSDDDVFAITAYLLYLNDLVEEDFVLTSDNFSEIRLPNENNFIADNRAEEPNFSVAVEPCMSDCIADAAVVSQRARVLDVTPEEQK